METSDLYRMIEALLEAGGQTGSSAAPVADTHVKKTTSSPSGGPGLGETIANTLLGGFPLFSLFKGLLDLGGGEETVPPLTKYQLPAAVNESAGYSANSGFVALDYTQSGLPRTPAGQQPQVTVQVNAMDSRSFLDHSDEIANAVREAVLNSHSLRDVLTEL